VAVAVMVLRKRDPERKRHFRVPFVWIVAPATIIGCILLYFNLPIAAMLFLPVWGAIGVLVYVFYSRSHSLLGQGIIEVVDDIGGEETMLPIHPSDT